MDIARNVHNGCGPPFGSPSRPLPEGDWRYQAPLSTVAAHYNRTARGTYKVTAAMYTEMDMGVADVVRALSETGMWESTLLIFASDNGGGGSCSLLI